MSDVVLRVENLSKLYRLGTIGTGSVSGDVQRFWKTKILGGEDPFLRIGQINDRTSKNKKEFVWALNDINFTVRRGEVLGILGKNGAGKSTLLKLLSRITSPTKGCIEYVGRMASLLEVGTGFHPELTGRENIFLNGAILGMSKKEIERKFSEIVDFSGCELYIDTPTKRYSSGMTVRLGFAVAAFLDPEILVVDEVLAVGDAEFQKKAIGKIKEVSSTEGRTVLFVSHNMENIARLCDRVLLLNNGCVAYTGNVDEGIKQYYRVESKNTINENGTLVFREHDLVKSIKSTVIQNNIEVYKIYREHKTTIRVELKLKIYYPKMRCVFQLVDALNNKILVFGTDEYKLVINKNDVMIEFDLAPNIFTVGDYTVLLNVGIPGERMLLTETEIMHILFTTMEDKKQGLMYPQKGLINTPVSLRYY